jgi:hypothetical protein
MNGIKVLGRLAAVALLLVSSLGQAEVLKFNFTAHGTSIDDLGPAPAGALALLPATSTISGSFFFDTTLVATASGNNADGTSYADYYSVSKVGVTLSSSAGYAFHNNVTEEYYEPAVHVTNVLSTSPEPYDLVNVTAAMNDGSGGTHDIGLMLSDRHLGATLTDNSLPLSLSMDNYSGTLFIFWNDNAGKTFKFNATLDTLQLAPVPEPHTYAMLLAGLGLLGVAARRKQRRAAA